MARRDLFRQAGDLVYDGATFDRARVCLNRWAYEMLRELTPGS